jgi:hypothetical protein
MGNNKEVLVCSICKKEFNSLRQLNSHKIVHSQKLIKCSKCGKYYKPGKEWFAHLNICYPKYHEVSEETRMKISLAKKGKPTWIKGKHHSEETRYKMSLAHKGHIAWNKGLTKYTDERIALFSEKLKHPKNWTIEGKEKLKMNAQKANEVFKRKFILDPIFKQQTIERARINGSKVKFKLVGKRLEEHKRKVGKVSKQLWQNPEYREKTVKAILKVLFKRPTSYEQKIIDLCKKYNLPFKYVGDGSIIIGYVNPDFIEVNGRKLNLTKMRR